MHFRPWVGIALLFTLVACGGHAQTATSTARAPVAAKPTAPPPFIDLIPADTAYVFSVAPISASATDEALSQVQALIDVLKTLRGQVGPSAEQTTVDRLTWAIVDELSGKLTVDGLASLGIDASPGLAIWGLGLLPVGRIQLADGEKFRALVTRILERTQAPVVEEKLGQTPYWWIEDELGFAFAVIGDELAFALVRPEIKSIMLPYVLGQKRPERTLADTRELAEIRSTYGFGRDHAVGFVHAVRIAEAVAHKDRGIHSDIWSGPEMFEHPACAREFPALFEAAPRLVFGWGVMTAERVAGKSIVELRPDIAAKLARMVSAVPGLSIEATANAQAAFGIGIHVGQLLNFVGEKAEAYASAGHQCPELKSFETDMRNLSRQLAAFKLLPVSGLRGFNFIFSQFDLTDAGNPLVAGIATVAADDPKALLSLLATYWPALAAAKPVAGEPPTRLDGLGLPMSLGPVHIATSHAAVGLSVGADQATRLSQVLALAPEPRPLLMLFRMDAALSARLDAANDDSSASVSSELSRTIRDLTRANMDTLSTATITEQGIVVTVGRVAPAR